MRFSLVKIIVGFGLLVSMAMICACTPHGVYHTVRPGQTLYRIAKTYDIEEAELVRINRISDPTKIKVGHRLYIPGATRPRAVPSTVGSNSTQHASPPAKVTTSTKSTAAPGKDTNPAPARTTQPPKSREQKSTSITAKSVKGIFVWPVKGKVLSEFGANQRAANKGIEIDAPSGSAVLASAPGKVIYSGNGIRGYGNLIILEHSDSYFSVYGYNKKNLVAMDDFVGQGDKIALSGSPPDGKSPRLHFEIRHGKAAVNPIFYLP